MWGGRFTARAVKSRVDAHLTEAFFCSRTSSRCTLGDDGGAFDVLLRGLGDPAASSSNVAALSSSSASSSGTSCISPSEPMSRGRLAPASPVLARGGVALEPIDVFSPDAIGDTLVRAKKVDRKCTKMEEKLRRFASDLFCFSNTPASPGGEACAVGRAQPLTRSRILHTKEILGAMRVQIRPLPGQAIACKFEPCLT